MPGRKAEELPPPATDEIEVTLLGRGVGECVIVHLLNDEWLIVDTFCENGSPAALGYLESIGVDKANMVKDRLSALSRE